MHKRILTLAAAVAVITVSCLSRTSAAHGGEGHDGTPLLDINDLIFPSPDGTTANYTVTGGDGSINYSSRYYDTDLVWGDTGVRFSNLNVPGSLPIMDGGSWSGPQRQAGIYFMESIPGIGLHTIKCKDHDGVVQNSGTCSLQWDDLYGYRSFRMRMDEGTITIEGYDPATGEATDNWFLSLITAREKGDDLPFTVIVPNKVSAEYKGRQYDMDIQTGAVALNRDDTPPVFNIYPSNGVITLAFHPHN